MNRETIVMCNCAGCRCGLLAARYTDADPLIRERLARAAFGGDADDIVAGRIDGRPYCGQCLATILALTEVDE